MDGLQTGHFTDYWSQSYDDYFVEEEKKDGTRRSVTCPEAVSAYNKCIGRDDLFDQLKERYSIGRRSKNCWFRICFFLVDLTIINA